MAKTKMRPADKLERKAKTADDKMAELQALLHEAEGVMLELEDRAERRSARTESKRAAFNSRVRR